MQRLLIVIIVFLSAASWVVSCGAENELTDVAVCTQVVEDRCPEDMPVIPARTPRIFAAGRLENAVAGTQVTGTLINMEGEAPLELATTTITVEEVTSREESFPVFFFTNTDPWTRGTYNVEIRVEGSESDPVTVEFEVS